MFVFPQLPGGYVGVVHETDIIIAKGRGTMQEYNKLAYLRVQLIDFLNGHLDVSRVYGSPNLDPFLNGLQIRFQLNIGFECEFLCSRRIAIGDEVVHNQVIDITKSSH